MSNSNTAKKAKAWVASNKSEITEKYRHQWIAVGEDGLVAHDEDIGKIMEELIRAKLGYDDVIFVYVDEMFGK